MKNHPLYGTKEGDRRIDVAARGVCRAREHPDCDGLCTAGCQATDEALKDNGSFDFACAAVVAIDRYDDAIPSPETMRQPSPRRRDR